jgi:hypothetical protein
MSAIRTVGAQEPPFRFPPIPDTATCRHTGPLWTGKPNLNATPPNRGASPPSQVPSPHKNFTPHPFPFLTPPALRVTSLALSHREC